MAEEGFLLGATALKQVEALIRRVQSQYWNPTQQRGRWQQQQPGQGCVRSYAIRLWWNPTDATMLVDVKYNTVTETITLDRGDNVAAVKAAFDAHSEFVADSVECVVDGTGEMWQGNMLVTLPAGASITNHSATMTRRSIYNPDPEFTVDICGCTGSSS